MTNVVGGSEFIHDNLEEKNNMNYDAIAFLFTSHEFYLKRSHDFVRHFDGVGDVFVRVFHTGETSLVLRRSQVHASL